MSEMTAEDYGFRLNAIAEAHHKHVDESGGTSGDCNECGWPWPCPTYYWAMDPSITPSCAWDAEDCAFEEHDHEGSLLHPSTDPDG